MRYLSHAIIQLRKNYGHAAYANKASAKSATKKIKLQKACLLLDKVSLSSMRLNAENKTMFITGA